MPVILFINALEKCQRLRGADKGVEFDRQLLRRRGAGLVISPPTDYSVYHPSVISPSKSAK
jgi:hypothetical protein